MRKPYTIDLNSDRCIYEEPGRRYIITTEVGHHYSGPPAKISVSGNKVSLEAWGTTLGFSAEEYAPFMVRGSIGHDDLPLTALSYETFFPHISEQVKYDWPPIGLSTQLFPE